ncbi:MAG: hypothetical protein K6G90_05755 [Clostridia bacterium]|nr:hypothetical protein [Clostridia bacterium]
MVNSNPDIPEVYSYHTFILPLAWKDIADHPLKFEKITDIFDCSPAWEAADPDPDTGFRPFDDALSFYAEYQYFYPQVSQALNGNDKAIVRNYVFLPQKVHEKATYRITKNERTYNLLINAIRLSVYNTGIALFILECENRDTSQRSLADVKSINEYGRRITLPFIPEQLGYSLCADKIGIEISPECRFETDFKAFIESINRKDDDQRKKDLHLNYLSSLIKNTLGYKSNYKFRSQPCDGKNEVYIHPAVDDRMFVCCLINDENATDDFLADGSYQKDIGKARSLYELVFLDTDGSCSCQSDGMLFDLLDKHLYKRWFNSKSIYSVAAQSLIMVFNGKAEYLIPYFLTQYVSIARLCLAQKASLILFQNEAAFISAKMRKDSRHKVISELMDLRERFSVFESQLCFNEITPQEQGIEIYAMFREFFFTDVCLTNVREQMEALNDSADTCLDLGFNKIGYIFAILGALYSLEEIFLEKLLPTDTPWFKWLGFSILAGALVILAVRFVYRRKRK